MAVVWQLSEAQDGLELQTLPKPLNTIPLPTSEQATHTLSLGKCRVGKCTVDSKGKSPYWDNMASTCTKTGLDVCMYCKMQSGWGAVHTSLPYPLCCGHNLVR